MTQGIDIVLFLTGAYPLWRAWSANRETSLLQAVNWMVAAWTVWGLAALAGSAPWPGPTGLLLGYLALCVSGCAGVAVLGARRPGAGAWNFVVLGLLAVLLLPVAEGWLLGSGLHLNELQWICLGGTLVVGILNYLPTRLGIAAIVFGIGCGWQMLMRARGSESSLPTGTWLGIVAWLALAGMAGRGPAAAEFDQLWLDFRDRFGFVWAQRLREQFNRSAHHAGWPVVLRWQGLRLQAGAVLPGADLQKDIVATLRALMKRFGAGGEGEALAQ